MNWGADVPLVEDLDRRMAAAVGDDGAALDMSDWHHPCGTRHCRAGWAVALAGEPGAALEKKVGTAAAAAAIYAASTPDAHIPNFYCDRDAALNDIRRRAAIADATVADTMLCVSDANRDALLDASNNPPEPSERQRAARQRFLAESVQE